MVRGADLGNKYSEKDMSARGCFPSSSSFDYHASPRTLKTTEPKYSIEYFSIENTEPELVKADDVDLDRLPLIQLKYQNRLDRINGRTVRIPRNNPGM